MSRKMKNSNYAAYIANLHKIAGIPTSKNIFDCVLCELKASAHLIEDLYPSSINERAENVSNDLIEKVGKTIVSYRDLIPDFMLFTFNGDGNPYCYVHKSMLATNPELLHSHIKELVGEIRGLVQEGLTPTQIAYVVKKSLIVVERIIKEHT